ncbi:MAG: tRNA (guanosine(37)-N1)-methyltransferase TrmD [Cytophagales bacterium]|nr:tRNA (guanosine(37)-N1)-methyltransferase TrmD [Armatimonadota bacterium]
MSSEPDPPEDAPRDALLRVDIITIFPEMVRNAASCSILGRAQTAGKLDLRVHDLRDHAGGRHRATDDAPFGGGAGMVMLPAPLFAAIEAATRGGKPGGAISVLLMAPDGEPFTQRLAQDLSESSRFVMVCGHYEGIDERVRERMVTREVSVGDYVLTGGELPALVILDATARLLPGVLGNDASPHEESFGDEAGLVLEYPHYTRPAEFQGMAVPEVLLSGHHANIAKWRRQMALVRTRARRPDLWEKLLPTLGKVDRKLLDAYDTDALEQQEKI